MGVCSSEPDPLFHDVKISSNCCNSSTSSSENTMSSIKTNASKTQVNRAIASAHERDPMGIVEERLPKGTSSSEFDHPVLTSIVHEPAVARSRAPTQSPPGTPPPEPLAPECVHVCFGCTEIHYNLCRLCKDDHELAALYKSFNLPEPGSKENPYDVCEEEEKEL